MIARESSVRRGISLIEMMVVISVVAALLGLSAVTMQVLLRVGSDAQSRRAASSTLGHLAEQFRADVHSCDEVELRPAVALRLKASPRVVIDYEVKAGRVARVETTDGKPGRHETYELGRDGTAAFERRDDGARRFLALVVGRKPGRGRPDPPHPLEILALVGKDRTGPARTGGGPPR